jgi:hypothetical protein
LRLIHPWPTPGFFSLEAAQQATGVGATVATTVATAGEQYQAAQAGPTLRVLHSEPATFWHKLDHLLYLPVLGLTRPADLYYYQGPGLQVLYGFTYKYLPLEQFLGQLTRLQIGGPMATALARRYSQLWYPGSAPLWLFTDWHVKPHWTKFPAHSGAITMWGRIMPGTKQLLINGPEGHLLGGWNYPVDSTLPGVLVELETQLAYQLGREIAYNVFDSEGGGLPTGLRYADAGRDYLSVLPRQGAYHLADFAVVGEWAPVENDPDHEAVEAHWCDPVRAQADPRRLVLMRRLGDTDPTRIYVGRFPVALSAASIPARFRQRWACQERRIRELVNGANLNANYGYTFSEVPNRTQRRRWEEAQARVEISERRLAASEEAVANLQAQLTTLEQTAHQTETELAQQQAERQRAVEQRQAHGQVWRRCAQSVQRLQRLRHQVQARFRRQVARLQAALTERQAHREAVQQELAERQAARDAVDTAGLCRERDLEKDQIMLDLQILLASLHDWVRQHYLAPEWQWLELDTAIELIYRKPGRVHWGPEAIEVVLEPYRYPAQQQAMEATCQRFNAAQLRWRDGRLLRIRVAPAPKFQLCGCQGAGQT